jgi:NADPH-dependent glutamate synthase beta subunit-like oxidoreductase/NAD(P)H-flavin reductase
MMKTLSLGHGFSFSELFTAEGLARLDDVFVGFLEDQDGALAATLHSYRGDKSQSFLLVSNLLLSYAPYLESFIGELFGIAAEIAAAKTATLSHNPIMSFKKQFVQRLARHYRGEFSLSFEDLDRWINHEIAAAGLNGVDREEDIARLAEWWLSDKGRYSREIDALTQWCALVLKHPEFESFERWVSFNMPKRIDHASLVPLERLQRFGTEMQVADEKNMRKRDGFHLTDLRMSRRAVQGEVHYCLYCHDHGGDFCSRGFPEKKDVPEMGFKKDPLGVILTGCPVDEKISEMHLLKKRGHIIAPLAIAMVDNPMVPATGHRICNDCMKACIYQKQDPVNIPQIETRILSDVLELPWGVEIYDLLTRWNPLRQDQYVMKPYNGRKVLIAGMGPAGFTMAHHLTMEGCAVVGIDGLKIEPLPGQLLEQPICEWSTLAEDLDERVTWGFGGVAEYGITVRWDKNFLKLIYIVLARRPTFQTFGGVRLGGTIALTDAWELGFDHVCIATGAGLPRVIPMANSLARGMRQASDFLMALQLTGAGKRSSLASLQVRLPAVVIGGGLTAVDTATEVQAYYIRQVEKVLDRFERMASTWGEERLRQGLAPEDAGILNEFLEHGRLVRAERDRAKASGEAPNFVALLHSWGGVTLTYRKGMNNSPAYTRNHEELLRAVEEGIYYGDGLDPLRAELDQYGHVKLLVVRKMKEVKGRWIATNEEIALPARAIFIAAGTVPNTIYEREFPGSLALDGNHFQTYVLHSVGLQEVQAAEHCKAAESGPFTSYSEDGRHVSFLGDTHPVFNGSVVKAIKSSKVAWPQIMLALEARGANPASYSAFRARIADQLTPRVAAVDRSRPGIVELWVRAPLAVRNFRPGQFFRLQTLETTSPLLDGTRLQAPPLTVSGAGVNGDMVRLRILQWGTGSRVAGRLQVGDPLVLMGPTGAPTDIPENKTIMVVAGRWGAALMLDIGPVLRASGNRVLYVATFGNASELDAQDELEAASDQIIWCTASGPPIKPGRPSDHAVETTDVIDMLRRYGSGDLQSPSGAIALDTVDRVMIMGSTGLLRAFQSALKTHFRDCFKSDLQVTATVGSPMQCMLKGVCAQCLQWQIDPDTGQRTRAVFSCAEQDQPLGWVDLDNLVARQTQNRLLEWLSNKWLDYLLTKKKLTRNPL